MNQHKFSTRVVQSIAVLSALLVAYLGWHACTFTATAQSLSPLSFSIRAVDATTGTPKNSFYLGEKVAVKFTVTNQSSVPQTITQLELTEIPVVLSSSPNRSDLTTMREGNRGGTGGATHDAAGLTIWYSVRKKSAVLQPGQAVSVQITDLERFFALTFDDGTYTLSATYNGILQSQTSFTIAIDPVNSLPVLQQLATSQNQATRAWANAYLELIQRPSISGRVTDESGQPLAGLTLELAGSQTLHIQTRADGRYDLNRLNAGGNYTLTPSSDKYTFQPALQVFANLTTPRTGVNFTATRIRSSLNVASSDAGGVATASSVASAHDYPVESVNDGNSTGFGWGNGTGGWQDGTPEFPDWIQIDFSETKAIDWINVYTLQDDFNTPTQPTLTQTFSSYGITDFDVQYWDGTGWAIVPGGQVSGNNKVWRKFSFPTITTSKIRVLVRNALAGHSRVTEIEAFHANKPPTVSIPGTFQGAPGATISFTSNAVDSDGSIQSYDWNFGDDTTGTGPNPSHTYVDEGTYAVTLTVTDDGGDTNTATTQVKIADPSQPPIAVVGGPYGGAPGTSIAFDGRASDDPDGTIVNYQWNFGDGTTASGSTQWHAYAQPGTYGVRLTVTDNSGLTWTDTSVATIAFPAPTVIMTAPSNGSVVAVGTTVPLVAQVSVPTGNVVTSVTFYSGSTLLGSGTLVGPPTTPPSYTFYWVNVPAGPHNLTARATDSGGNSGSSTPITLSVFAPPTVSITAPSNNSRFIPPASIVINATAAASNASISKVEFFQGTTKIGEDNAAPYSITWSNVGSGTYQLTARATDSNNLSTSSTPITVVANSLPTVSLTSPQNEQVFPSPGNVSLIATAADIDGTISKVDFYQGATLLGTDTSSPFSYAWTNVPTGSYSITAKATDNLGDVKTSAAISILVNNSPSVSITSPVGGTLFNAPATIGINATAADNDGTISKVEFYQNGVKLGEDATAPYSFNWTNVAASNYSLVAKATDNLGGITSSNAVNVTVNAPPTVSITGPPSGTVFTAPASLTISANAVDSDGTISKVEFFQGSTLIGTVTTASHAMIWSNVSGGTYSLTAKATDNRGVTTTSSAVTLIVNSVPTISITSPANNSSFSQPASTAINVSVSDADGTISKVEFFDGSTKLGETLTAPFSFSWNPIPGGAHSLTAKATDNRGATATSPAIAIVVTSVVRTNFALTSQGGFASASSIFNLGFAPVGTNNGDRRGTNWGAWGGGWTDASPAVFPDWLQIDFQGSKTIDEIDVFTLQDNYGAPVEPTETMTFATYGITAFDVQYWNGTSWVTVPGGSVTSNNKIWRKVAFSPITTSKIRVLINGSADGSSRITEVEAWGMPPAPPMNVALAANGATASASSVLSLTFPAAATNNGDRKGTTFGSSSSGGWADASFGSFPDWLQIDFGGSKTINEIDVFTLQDDFPNASEPTETMLFASYGVTAYDAQYWNGTAWVTVPGGSITGNNKVWRKITFPNITTSKIRVMINAAKDNGYSRLVEVEAWGPN